MTKKLKQSDLTPSQHRGALISAENQKKFWRIYLTKLQTEFIFFIKTRFPHRKVTVTEFSVEARRFSVRVNMNSVKEATKMVKDFLKKD